MMSFSVAVLDERRRILGLLPLGGLKRFEGAIVVYTSVGITWSKNVEIWSWWVFRLISFV